MVKISHRVKKEDKALKRYDFKMENRNSTCKNNCSKLSDNFGRTILFLYVPRFQREVFKHVKFLQERSKEIKEQRKNKGSVLVAESAYNAQNAQLAS